MSCKMSVERHGSSPQQIPRSEAPPRVDFGTREPAPSASADASAEALSRGRVREQFSDTLLIRRPHTDTRHALEVFVVSCQIPQLMPRHHSQE